MCKSFVVLISLDLQITEDITTNWFAHKLHIFASLTLAFNNCWFGEICRTFIGAN